jgi:O-acetyl-ADP-ribose deacetylase (regulator of RNase III)
MRYLIIHPDEAVAHTLAAEVRRVLSHRRSTDPKEQDGRVKIVPADLSEAVLLGARADALITPGDSYGDMSGGFDLAVRNLLGQGVQHQIQTHIQHHYFGELNVGAAFVTKLHDITGPFQHLVYAPTMRVPRPWPPDSDVPYLSMLAALQAIGQYNYTFGCTGSYIGSMAFTAHGHGYGKLSLATACRQIAMAVEQFESRPLIGTFDATARDKLIRQL